MWPANVICKNLYMCPIFCFYLNPFTTYFAESLGTQWNLELEDFQGMRPRRHFVCLHLYVQWPDQMLFVFASDGYHCMEVAHPTDGATSWPPVRNRWGRCRCRAASYEGLFRTHERAPAAHADVHRLPGPAPHGKRG